MIRDTAHDTAAACQPGLLAFHFCKSAPARFRSLTLTCALSGLLVWSAQAASSVPFDLTALQSAVRASVLPPSRPPTRFTVFELAAFLPHEFAGNALQETFSTPMDEEVAVAHYKSKNGGSADIRLLDFFRKGKSALEGVLEETRGLSASIGMADKQGPLSVRLTSYGPGLVVVEQTQRQASGPAETSVVNVFVAGRYEFEVSVFERGAGGHSLGWARDAAKHAALDILAHAPGPEGPPGDSLDVSIERTLKILRTQVPRRPSAFLSAGKLKALLPSKVGTATCTLVHAPEMLAAGQASVNCLTADGRQIGGIYIEDAARRSGPWPSSLLEPDDGPPSFLPDGGELYIPHGSGVIQPARHVVGLTWGFVAGGQLVERALFSVEGRVVYDLFAYNAADLQRLMAAVLALPRP
ncbi:hypothetical protein [Deinococcus alpinitundrae]|uniref:hypothetical protein n=1 Tax=Deinococcus alpinitundrae TaxID=468913 RepID=UPI00137AD1F1|nr:hypothetical protein [Deinococcus alpinitundrae]